MSFATDLDRYLTTPPQNRFVDYAEAVIEAFTEDFFEEQEDWIMNTTKQCDVWLDALFYKEYPPKLSAQIIERAFNIFISKT